MIEVITGPMFAGKTEELIRRLRRVELAKVSFQAFKPAMDVRYATDAIVSHDARRIPVHSVLDVVEVAQTVGPETQVIGIDEAQFFDAGLATLAENLANEGRRVIIAGLDLHASGRPFGHMPELLAVADHVTKLTAICARCGAEASRSKRIVEGTDLLVGGREAYEARCRRCWT